MEFNQYPQWEQAVVTVNKHNPEQAQAGDGRHSGGRVTPLKAARRKVNGSATASQVVSEDYGVDLEALQQAIRQLPEVDATRSMNLYNRIMAEEYEVDAGEVARKLLDLESQLSK